MDNFLLAHLTDLSEKTDRQGIFTFSDFLTPEEQSALLGIKRQTGYFEFFGGADGTERNVVRFGNPADFGYTEDYPILCLKVSPKNVKYAEKLSHRDYLGALMSLGIERNLIGDIIVKGADAYIFCLERIKNYLTENLTSIRHTDVKTEVCTSLPEGKLFETQELRLTVTSLRLDCVFAGVSNKSRSNVDELLRQKKVFLNSVICENGAKTLSPGDKVSVRGFGKFILADVIGASKKGKEMILIEKYV